MVFGVTVDGQRSSLSRPPVTLAPRRAGSHAAAREAAPALAPREPPANGTHHLLALAAAILVSTSLAVDAPTFLPDNFAPG